MKIVFMGTPEFAVPSLDALVRNGHDVVLVVTQKDKPRDRGKETKASAVKEYALSAGLSILQPERLKREPDMVEAIHQTKPDLLVTCAFGQLLPQSVLDIPAYGTLNVHGSLLPVLRGAAPIQWAILNGHKQTGITTMFTDIGLDTGDMLLKEIVEIPEDMTASELHDMMSVVGAATLIKTLHEMEAGTLSRHRQEDELATYAPRITKDMGRIDWRKTAWEIHNLVRGLEPWPGAYTQLGDKMMRVVSTMSPGRPEEEMAQQLNGQGIERTHAATPAPGTILEVNGDGLLVQAGDKPLLIQRIQMPSSRRMLVADWLNGHAVAVGTVLE